MKKNKKNVNLPILARYAFIIIGMVFIASMIVYKMFDTTVVSAAQWNAKAEKYLSVVDTIYPMRGDILADDGSVLATNMMFYNVRIDFACGPFRDDSLRKYIEPMADSLHKYFPKLSVKEWRDTFMAPLALEKKNRPRPVKILENISYADYLRMRTFPFLNQPNRYRCGVVLESHERRVNPYGAMARRSIGGVGQTEECDERHGIWGLERSLDSLLYGQVGLAKRIQLTKGIADWTDRPAVPGYDITTTIDINLQELVDNELSNGLEYCGADWGVAILMDVKTGDIKAISNLELSKDGTRYVESLNRAVQRYEPGSVVKTLSMLIALEDGIVKGPNSTFDTEDGVWIYEGRKITDSHRSKTKTATQIISESSNIGMAKIILSKYASDPGSFRDRLEGLGLFEPMNTGIAGEVNPMVAKVKSNRNGRLALSRMAYGYTTEFSPMWTLSIYNAIANNGRFVRPRLVTHLHNEAVDSTIPLSYIRPRICTEANAAILRDMLVDVVENPQGTGRALKSDIVRLAGKTGTCYVIENGQYNQSAKRLTFCGFFPADNPVYSCIVLVSRPTRNAFGAASTSGNIFRTIAHKLYARGMFNNYSNFLDETHEGTVPTFYATLDPSRHSRLRDMFNIGKSVALAGPACDNTVKPGVPDVRGLGLREAIRQLEGWGLNVTTEGIGYVYSQSPAPGEKLKPGSKVFLKLRN